MAPMVPDEADPFPLFETADAPLDEFALEPAVEDEDDRTPEEIAEETPARLWGWRNPLIILVVALLLSQLLRLFIITPFRIPSESMEPALTNGDRVFVNQLAYDIGDIERGDVIVFKAPAVVELAGYKDLIKRVVGLPGDTVQFKDCGVYIDGVKLDEPYIQGECTDPPDATVDPNRDGLVQIPAGEVFVMGDNRVSGQSYDSRFWGPLDEKMIVGRAFALYWPTGHLRWL